MRDALGGERIAEQLGLAGRHDAVLVALEQQHRHLELLDVVERGALDVEVLPLRVRADETVDVARFEVVGVQAELLELGDTEARGARGEGVGAGEAGQRGPPAGAATSIANRPGSAIPAVTRCSMTATVSSTSTTPHCPRRRCGRRGRSRSAAVVHVDHPEPAGGVVRGGQMQHRETCPVGPPCTRAMKGGNSASRATGQALLVRAVDDRGPRRRPGRSAAAPRCSRSWVERPGPVRRNGRSAAA